MGSFLSTCSKDDALSVDRENPPQINHGDANSLTSQSSQVESKDLHGTDLPHDKDSVALLQGFHFLLKPGYKEGDGILSDYLHELIKKSTIDANTDASAKYQKMSLSLITISLITLKQLTIWTTEEKPWMLNRIEDFTQYDEAPQEKVLRTLTIRSMVIPHSIARMTLAMLITNGLIFTWKQLEHVELRGTMAGTDRYRLFQAPTGSTSNTVNSFDDLMTLLTHELLLSSLTLDRLPIERSFYIGEDLANRIRAETLVTKTALNKNKFFDLLDKDKLFNWLKNDNRLRNMIDAILKENGVPITTVKNDRALLEPCVTQPESVLSIYATSSI